MSSAATQGQRNHGGSSSPNNHTDESAQFQPNLIRQTVQPCFQTLVASCPVKHGSVLPLDTTFFWHATNSGYEIARHPNLVPRAFGVSLVALIFNIIDKTAMK
jgi:hypothetical protein